MQEMHFTKTVVRLLQYILGGLGVVHRDELGSTGSVRRKCPVLSGHIFRGCGI